MRIFDWQSVTAGVVLALPTTSSSSVPVVDKVARRRSRVVKHIRSDWLLLIVEDVAHTEGRPVEYTDIGEGVVHVGSALRKQASLVASGLSGLRTSPSWREEVSRKCLGSV